MTHIILVGDTGIPGGAKPVGRLIKKLHTELPVDAVGLLGDNVYPNGLPEGEDFTLMIQCFKKIFPQGLDYYAILGNHDYHGNTKAQIEYGKHNKQWHMPQTYYHKVVGVCDIFFLDTNVDEMEESEIETQKQTMLTLINNSKQKWKILCGHHTWHSVGGHGNADKKLDNFLKTLVTTCRYPIDMYVCGHDHCKSVINLQLPPRQLCVIVSGGGGANYPDVEFDNNYRNLENVKGKHTGQLEFYAPSAGVLQLKADKSKMTCGFVDCNGMREWERTFHKK